jgi:hypothetical protein
MNASELRKTLDWGWTSYKRCAWAGTKDGRRLYGAHFRADSSAPLGWRTLYIQFWAQHPIRALREIADSGRDPNEFNGQVMN